MKRKDWVVAAAELLVGAVFIALGFLTDTKLDGIFFGLAGAGICSGAVLLGQCVYRQKPERAQAYGEKLAQERIEQKDELKEMLRGKTARYLYTSNTVLVGVVMLALAVLDSLEVVENGSTIVIYLWCYLILQMVAATVIYNRLLKKYTE